MMKVVDSEGCLYFGCTARKRNKKNENLSFFRLPVHNEEVTKNWIINCNRYGQMGHLIENKFNKQKLANFIVCEKHFEPKNIMFNNKRKLLFRNAVPIPYKHNPSKNVEELGRQPIFKGLVCCVKDCSKTSAEGNSRVNYYYSFPKETDLRRKWLECLGITEDRPDLYVCSKHFGPDAFYENPDERRAVLKKSAFPVKVISYKIVEVPEEKVPKEKLPGEKVTAEKVPEEKVLKEKIPEEKVPEENVPEENESTQKVFSYCINCQRKRIPLTDQDKKKLRYYFREMKRYSEMYETQTCTYRKKNNRMQAKVKKREKELKEMTAAVNDLKEEVALAEVELVLLKGGDLHKL